MKTFITSIGELNNHLEGGYKPCNLYTYLGTKSVFETGFAFRNCLDIAMLNPDESGTEELIKLNTSIIEDKAKEKILNLIRDKKQLLSDYGINEYLIPQNELDADTLDTMMIKVFKAFNKEVTVVYIDDIDKVNISPEQLLRIAKVNEVAIIVNKFISSEKANVLHTTGSRNLLDNSTFVCKIERSNKLDKENGLLQFEVVKTRNPIMPVGRKFTYAVEDLYK